MCIYWFLSHYFWSISTLTWGCCHSKDQHGKACLCFSPYLLKLFIYLWFFCFFSFGPPYMNILYLRIMQTWKSGEEDSVKPSVPGCLIKDRAPGVSCASVALKETSPNDVAWVSGWALSCRTAHTHRKIRNPIYFFHVHSIQLYFVIYCIIPGSWICAVERVRLPGSHTLC